MSGRIRIDPKVNGGKPTVTGTRVSVEDVLACLEYTARLAGHSVTFEKIA